MDREGDFLNNMSSSMPKLNDIAAEWRAARRVYSIYAAVLKRFDLGVEPCRVLVLPIDRADDESLTSMREWLAKMDEQCTALQLRQTVQAASIGTEPSLRFLAQRYLAKEDGLDAYRDRVDFLLVQYFCQFAPSDVHQREPKLEDVAKVLEPIIGEASLRVPTWAAQIELLLVRLAQCATLKQLEHEGILRQGRELKEQAGAMYFGSGVMVAFTRYNFLVRRAFVRLMSADLEAVRSSINELERRKVPVVDASGAGLTAQEPLSAIRKECRDWKKIFLADYAGGGAFAKIIALREVVERALKDAPKTIAVSMKPESIAAQPASASAKQSVPDKAVADPPDEFELLVAANDHFAQQPKADPVSYWQPGRAVAAAPVPKAELVAKEGMAVSGEAVPKTPAPVVVAPRVQPPAAERLSHPQAPMPEQLHAVASELATDDSDGLDVDLTFPLADALEKITEQLSKAELQKVHLAVATVTLGTTRILLSSWEVDAFLRGRDDLAETLQIATTARAVLTEALDRRKRTGVAPDLRAVLAMANAEAGALQERIAQARDAKNLDAAVNLSATSRRLIGLMDEAEAVLRGLKGRAQ